jgi:hypothetical protein
MRYDGTPDLKQRVPARLPAATVSILLVTGILTGLQFAFPQILPALMRSPAAVSQHEWWRFVTPLLVHADGWKQIAFVFPAVLVVGTLAERIHGSRQVLLSISFPDLQAKSLAWLGSLMVREPRLLWRDSWARLPYGCSQGTRHRKPCLDRS